MNNIKAICGILLVFMLGAASGAIVTHVVERAHFEKFIHGGPEAREEKIMGKLTKQLALDSQQQVQIRSIVHENHTAMRQIRKQYRPQIQEILDHGQARISDLLRPEQRERFRQIIEERKRHRPPEDP